jgi:glycine dehydrogenase
MLSPRQEFAHRHIGPKKEDVKKMLAALGFSNLEELANHVIPRNIRSSHSFQELGDGESEFDLLARLKAMLSQNKVYSSYIGLGYHDTITPTVIQRNILENPVWYTAYTPYQPEIAQGRLEALLNFQTMVTDLTGMEIANASLLDEGTAAAEAVAMAHNLYKGKSTSFVASPGLHPHVLAVLKTRMEPLGLKLKIVNPLDLESFEDVFAAVVSYPSTDGRLEDYSILSQKLKKASAFLIADADLLALTLLTPPGEWGADIVFGNSQRFGVPLGNGGPHAAFLATKDAFKRNMPGRIVGVSVDAKGEMALRLALQTREQHIRREKATSNICTAQVLLANMASMYAVYHGPVGLKNIALRIHGSTQALSGALQELGYEVENKLFFDTLRVKVKDSSALARESEIAKINLRLIDSQTVGISLNEKVNLESLQKLIDVFARVAGKSTLQVKIKNLSELSLPWPQFFVRSSKYLTHPVFNSHHSETQLLRYIHHLQNKDLTLTHSMIALGSCTMKLNATTELVPVSWPEVNGIHPFAPQSQMRGTLQMIEDLERKLCDITGFAAVTLQPNAGSQGEFSGLLVIRKYHMSRGQGHRNICLIPSSAHGTNPATATMTGMQVVVVNCDEQGNVDVSDLKAKALAHKENLAALMITYPSTHGVFEEAITEICKVVHDHGGQVYMDGANLNALVALCRPGEFGPDVSHMNLHKTFAIPHGGGGPGVGPIGVAAHLKEFLPNPQSQLTPHGDSDAATIGFVSSAPYGSASILPISWAYITMMGAEGLKQATLVSILNANYIAKRLEKAYPILYKGREGLVAHECILDLRPLKKTSGIDVVDVAKRLMDFGFHAPTMSFPVAGTLMVEPTESEDLGEIERFIQAMLQIREEIQQVEKGTYTLQNNPLVHAPHTAAMVMADEWTYAYSRKIAAFPAPGLKKNKYWPSVARVDNAYGDKNVMCSCPPMESYSQ